MDPLRIIKFLLLWLVAWAFLGAIAVGTTVYYSMAEYQKERHSFAETDRDRMGFPSQMNLWVAGLGAGTAAFGAAMLWWRRGDGRGAEVHQNHFLVYDGADSVRVSWPEVVRITAGPEPDSRLVSIRLQVAGRPGVLKVHETSPGFAELKEKLHMVYGAPDAWLAAASQKEIVLYER